MFINTIRRKFSISWLIWFLAALFYAYEFLIRVSPTVMVTYLMHDFSIHAAALGVMGSCFYWTYSLSQVPAGMLVDRFGAKRLMLCAISLVIAGCLLFASVHNVSGANIARLITGLGSAFAFICTLKLISVWFPPHRFAQLAGLTNLMGYTGATLGGAPLVFALEGVGWRMTYVFIAAFGVLLVICIAFVIPPRSRTHYRDVLRTKTGSVFKGFRSVLQQRQNWFNAMYAGLIVAPVNTFAALWGVPYLVQVDHIRQGVAAGATSVIFVGVAVGSPFFGWFSDKIKRRRSPLIFVATGALVVTLILLYDNTINIDIVYVLCFLFGFFHSGQVINFAIAHEINRPAANGVAIGFTNMAVILSGAICLPLVGLLIDWEWKGASLHGVPLFSTANYHHALFVLPICQVLAILISLFLIRETYCEEVHGHVH